MVLAELERVFTHERPLGPVAIDPQFEQSVLEALYDDRVSLHLESKHNPPTFIVGRRGSGKTALLLSSRSLATNVVAHISTDGIYNRVKAIMNQLRPQVLDTPEAIAEVWRLLLWAPVILRLVEQRTARDDPSAFQRLWDATKDLRANLRAASRPDGSREDDRAVDLLARQLHKHVENGPPIFGTDTLGDGFLVGGVCWNPCIDSAKDLLEDRRTKAFVLIDSLEDIGAQLEGLNPTLQGLFHLIGRTANSDTKRIFQLQCCFPSELWPELGSLSSNPVKDLEHRIVLQWHGSDLLELAGKRLRIFLDLHKELDHFDNVSNRELIEAVLPPEVVNLAGRRESVVAYTLRHTQLLPRQFLYILNVALGRALLRTGIQLDVTVDDVVGAVTEVEAILCPEIFRAHAFRYPNALTAAKRLIPYLPFRFSDSDFHEMVNESGIPKAIDMDYREVREMFVHVGILGRVLSDTDYYIRGEFEYTVEGGLNLGPDDEYCLHPLFVRQYASRDVTRTNRGTRPVYPLGTPEE